MKVARLYRLKIKKEARLKAIHFKISGCHKDIEKGVVIQLLLQDRRFKEDHVIQDNTLVVVWGESPFQHLGRAV